MSDIDHQQIMERAHRVMARANDVMERIDQRGGSVQQAARRERQRLNKGLGRVLASVAVAIGLIWLGATVVGLIVPIGMMGFVAAILATAVVAGVLVFRGGLQTVAAPAPSADLRNGRMVERFDSYIFRVRSALPAPAQAQIDGISALLPSLKQVLEPIETLDPRAQDARRLMSIHLPGLIDRYRNVPAAFKSERDGEGKTVDERLVDGLAAARAALQDVSEQLAREDLAAFETQGRFIKSRYGDDPELQATPTEKQPDESAADNQR
jgi:hypothetical protein